MSDMLTERPHTRASLAANLASLGVAPGMTLIAHCSLSSIGWVVSGAQALIWALMDAVGPDGTLVMPTFSGGLTDPAGWTSPPIDARWFDRVRTQMLPFDPARTPTRNMGAVPESFRTWPGVYRSFHPVFSFAAWGRDAAAITEAHPLDWSRGPASPLGRIYERDGSVLLIGVGHNRNSSLHLGETRARHRRTQGLRMPIERNGAVVWETHDDVATDGGKLFPRIGAAFEETGAAVTGRIGTAESRLMRQRALVDFAAHWLDTELADELPLPPR